MTYTFSLTKINDVYALRIHKHNPIGERDGWEIYSFNSDEIQSLRDVLGVRELEIKRVNTIVAQLKAHEVTILDLTKDIRTLEKQVQGVVTHLRGT